MAAGATESRNVLAEAIALDRDGEKDDADAAFRRAIQLNPQFAQAYERYALFLYAQREYQKGVELMKRAVSTLPGQTELKAYLGMHLYRTGQIVQAYELFKAAENEIGDRYEVQVVFAQVARVMNDYERVLRLIDSYFKHRPEDLSRQDFVFETLAAEALVNQGKMQRSATLLRRVLGKNVFHRPARVVRALWLVRNNYCDRAVRGYLQLFKREKLVEENRRLTFHLGEAYVCLRQHTKAQETLSTFLEHHESELQKLLANPRRRDVYPELADPIKTAVLLRGDEATKQGQLDVAVEAYRKALKLHERSVPVLMRLARTHFQKREYGEVLDVLGPELRKRDVSSAIVIMALRASIRAKKRAEAIALADRLVQQKDPPKEHFYYAGMAYSSSGNVNKAAELLERGDVSNANVKRELVRVYCRQATRAIAQKNTAQALGALRRALHHDPNNMAVNRNLAVYFYEQNNGAAALVHARAMMEANRNDPVANHLMGRGLALQEQYAEAGGHYKVALQGFEGSDKDRAALVAEAAFARIKAGEVEEGMEQLLQVAKQKQAQSDPQLAGVVRRNLARAHLVRGQHYLEKGNMRQSWRELNIALKESNILSPQERVVTRVMVALAAIATGKIAEAKKLIQDNRAQITAAMNPEYSAIGLPLLLAYADSFSRSPQQVQNAAGRIARLAGRVPSPAKDSLQNIAGSLYMSLGARLFRGGNHSAARNMVNQARKLSDRPTPEMRHNLAVADYYGGAQPSALKSLEALARTMPVALCNLAVHYETRGAMDKAHEMFSRCLARGGGAFPGVRSIVAIKDAVFGKKQ